ncbi:glycosyltransferase family 4 protein [Kribbella sp. NPDC058245]|uniref:glycosyltransferase family 4 protein n=1 Tax=Kribbella sp. NPDC058245 TaxID=3346399 RepID=UPI0036E70655
MRIALVSDCYLPRLGGIELHVHDLAVQLNQAGHEVTVFTTTPGPAEPSAVGVVRLPAIPRPSAIRAVRDFDVVHAHTSIFSPLAWRAARVAEVPLITLHSLPSASIPWPIARLDRYVGTARWTAVSEVVADVLRSALPGRSVGILHNGIDPAQWQQLRLSHQARTVVSTMRLTRRKRPLALLQILERVREAVPAEVPLRAVIAGEGNQEAALVGELRRRGLAGWVELPGRLSRFEIRQLYAAADVYLAPAGLESFGIAALEARSAGLPVVAMASGGVREFIRPGIEGYLVGSDREMADTTAMLLTDPDLLSRISEHNLRTDPAMVWDQVVADHLDAYQAQRALSTPHLASAL